MWPALARQVARCSSDDDRALLTQLCQHPELRAAGQPFGSDLLYWGLKYFVRGDLLLEDGSEITLDQLCDLHQLPRLPYLEEAPILPKI